jgi:hypothetical protein
MTPAILIALAVSADAEPLVRDPPSFHGGTYPHSVEAEPRALIDARSYGAPATALAGGDGAWSVPFVHPASRYLHCAVYDPVRKRKIVFGGYGHTLSLIWTLSLDDRPQWSSFTVAGEVPASRYGATAIYDPPRDRVIMFGGAPQFGARTNEVWALSLSGVPAWTRLEDGGLRPPPRFTHTAIYESSGDRMIVYGGQGTSSVLGDVWALDLTGATGWTELLPATPLPPARSRHAATYDAARDRMIVYGGNGPDFRDINDTWELALSGTPAWRTIADPGPGRCVGHSLIYDPIGDRAVLLGGNQPAGRFSPLSSGIWFLPAGGTAWTNIRYHPYFEVDDAPAVYDAGRHHIVAYNGRDAMNIADIRLKDLVINYPPVLPTPWRSYGHSAIYDSKHERMLIYGGRGQDSPLGETWELTLSGTVRWSMLAPEGPEREFHSAIYDPMRDRMIIFSGFPGGSETWELRLSGSPAWSQLSTAGAPPEERRGHSAIYDPRRDRMIVFGGGYWGASRGDAWALSLAANPTWTALPPGPSRIWHHAVYDPVGDRMLVLGGSEGYQPKAEVWALSLEEPMTWSLLASEGGGPFPRDGATTIYDPVRHRVVVSGGCCYVDEDYNDHAFADAWELSLDGPLRWRHLTTAGNSGERMEARMIYDPPRDRAIVYGGKIPYEIEFTDVWALTWGEPAKPAAFCAGTVVPDSPLRLRYAVSNALPATRSVEWSLASERALPGLPRRGFLLVGGGATDTVRLELPIPEEALDAPNTLTFASWFSGAAPYADTCRSRIPQRPKVIGFELVPHTLNLASEGRWVTGYLEPAPPLEADDIDIASIRLNGTVTVDPAAQSGIGDHDRDGIRDLMVRFSRRALEQTVSTGDSVPVTVTGTVDGQPFTGRDFIRALQPGKETNGREKVVDDGAITSIEPSLKHALAIRRVNGAAGGRLEVELTLRDGSPARLELMDVAGRALLSRQVGVMGAGRHTFELTGGRALHPGIYFLRLTQSGIEARTRVAILR